MSQKLIYNSLIIVFIVFNQLIYLSAEHLYSEPDLTNPYIPEELRESCGYRYVVSHFTIKYSEQCFGKSYADRKITIAFNGVIDKVTDVETPTSRVLGERKKLTNKYITIPINGSQTQLIGEPTNRVLAGQRVKFREAPWVVQIVKRNFHWWGELDKTNFHHHCTGVLITMRYILTAAHCKQDDLSVYLGRDNSTEGWRSHDFVFTQHHKYDTGTTDKDMNPIYDYDYDIAIIDLKTSIDWTKYGKDKNGMYLINTICLPLPENMSDPYIANNYYQKATIFGWGKVKGHTYPKFIQRGDLLVKKSIFPRVGQLMRLTSYADNNETRPCLGDSGSGIVQYIDRFENRAVLIAIQSQMTIKTDKEDRPCNFKHIGPLWAVRVVEYLDWINKYLKQN